MSPEEALAVTRAGQFENWGPIPAGHELRAESEGDDWRLADPSETCSQPRCRRPAVMMLRRTRMARNGYKTGAPPVAYWWGCCAYHTYGRWIEDGKVTHCVLRERAA